MAIDDDPATAIDHGRGGVLLDEAGPGKAHAGCEIVAAIDREWHEGAPARRPSAALAENDRFGSLDISIARQE